MAAKYGPIVELHMEIMINYYESIIVSGVSKPAQSS